MGRSGQGISGFCPLSCLADQVPSPPAAVMSCWPATAAGTRRPPPSAKAGRIPLADRCPSRLDPAQPTSGATPRGSTPFRFLGLDQSAAVSCCQNRWIADIACVLVMRGRWSNGPLLTNASCRTGKEAWSLWLASRSSLASKIGRAHV